MAVFEERIRPLCSAAQCIVRTSSIKEFEKRLCNATITARTGASSSRIPDFLQGGAELTPAMVAQAGWGANIVMESYGGVYFQPSLDIINAGGTLATFGSTSYNGRGRGSRIALLPLVLRYLRRPRIDPGVLSSRNLRVGGFNLIYLTENNELLSQAFKDCVECLSGSGSDRAGQEPSNLEPVTPPHIGEAYNFASGAVKALKSLRRGMTTGKVILDNVDNPLLAEAEPKA